MKKIVILYHKNCPDGFGAAWAAWKKFGNKANYIPVEYQTPPPKNLKGKEVYSLDFSYPAEVIKKLKKITKKLVFLDHHITAKENIKFADFYVYNVNHSGAFLTWRYFHPKKATPKLILYIEDRDLWNFKLAGAREITTFLKTLDLNLKEFDKLAVQFERADFRKKYFETGKILLAFKEQIISGVASQAEKVRFLGIDTLAANSPILGLRSEIGEILYDKKPPMSIIWLKDGDDLLVSLRSKGDFDISKLAKRFGGGGHKNAGGFRIKKGQKIPWKKIK